MDRRNRSRLNLSTKPRQGVIITQNKFLPDLPAGYDGCDAPYCLLQHALACKKGGLVICPHNEIRDELVNLPWKAFIPSAVRDKPLTQLSCVKESQKDTPTKDTSQEKMEQTATGHVAQTRWPSNSPRILGKKYRLHILDVCVTDSTDAKSYSKRNPAKVLESQARRRRLARKSLHGQENRVWNIQVLLAQKSTSLTRIILAKLVSFIVIIWKTLTCESLLSTVYIDHRSRNRSTRKQRLSILNS